MSILIRDPVEQPTDVAKWRPTARAIRHRLIPMVGRGELALWPERYWSGAWVTPSGRMIRGQLDELLADEVRAARV